ncbi:MAG: hypothetical protein HYZ49_10555 [Chloroflexi bacterium]|nr:hypothetical protein [Chloroflexota bacterium]
MTFWLDSTTFNNEAGSTSKIQAIEFTMNKWHKSNRYEFALQWQNVGDGAPQWRYWNPCQTEKWVGVPGMSTFPASEVRLRRNAWHTLVLKGNITANQEVHYQEFSIDGKPPHALDITIPPVADTPSDDHLAIAIQLDGNALEAPYDVFLDSVHFTREYAPNTNLLLPPPCTRMPKGLASIKTMRPLFDWDKVGEASSYNLQIATDQNFTRLVQNLNVTSSAYAPTIDLPKGTTLFWRVRANRSNGTSSVWSRVRHFDTPNPPSVPALLLPANGATVTNNKPTLDWSDSTPGLEHYEVQISTSTTFATLLGRGQGGRTVASQYTPEAALPIGTYYWRVRAVNAQGEFSQWSAARSFRVL